MHPLLIAGIVAGAFFLGRSGREKAKRIGPPPGAPIPVPDPDAPLPLPEGSEADYSEAWAALPYGVEVYPPGAPTPFPPPEPDSLVAGPGCTVIAVADGWWDVAGSSAQALVDAGAADAATVFNGVAGKYLPNCVGKATKAYSLLKAELMERLKELFPQAEFAEKPALDIQVPMKQGSQVFTHNKPGVGQHVIILQPTSYFSAAAGQHVYAVLWWVWKPGPVIPGQHIREGAAPDVDEALAEAKAAIDEYVPGFVQNQGAQFTIRSTAAAGLGKFPRRRGLLCALRGTPKRRRGYSRRI
jgi:hypothetical protein